MALVTPYTLRFLPLSGCSFLNFLWCLLLSPLKYWHLSLPRVTILIIFFLFYTFLLSDYVTQVYVVICLISICRPATHSDHIYTFLWTATLGYSTGASNMTHLKLNPILSLPNLFLCSFSQETGKVPGTVLKGWPILSILHTKTLWNPFPSDDSPTLSRPSSSPAWILAVASKVPLLFCLQRIERSFKRILSRYSA